MSLSLDKNKLIKLAIILIMGMAIMAIPTTDVWTYELKMFIAWTLSIILLLAFEIANMFTCGLALISGYIVLKVCPASTAISGLGSQNFWMTLMILLFVQIMNNSGLAKRVGFKVAVLFGGSYRKVCIGITVASVAMSFITFGNESLIILAIVGGLVAATCEKDSNQAAFMLMIGLTAICTMRSVVANALFARIWESGGQTVDPTFAIGVFDPLIYNWPIFIWFGLFVWFMPKLLKIEKQPYGGGLEYLQEELRKIGPITSAEKKATVILLLFVIALATARITGISQIVIFCVVPLLGFLPGINLINGNDLVKQINWGVIIFCAACFSIGTVGTSVGLGDVISTFAVDLLTGANNAFAICGTIYGIGMFANLILTPMALITLLSVPVAQIAAGLDFGLMPTYMTLYHSMGAIFMPHENAYGLIIMAMGLMKMNQFIKIMTWKTLSFSVFLMLVLVPYWLLLGQIL